MFGGLPAGVAELTHPRWSAGPHPGPAFELLGSGGLLRGFLLHNGDIGNQPQLVNSPQAIVSFDVVARFLLAAQEGHHGPAFLRLFSGFRAIGPVENELKTVKGDREVETQGRCSAILRSPKRSVTMLMIRSLSESPLKG